MTTARTAPVLVYDGDCGFCTTCVRYAERHLRPRCTITAWQDADLDALGVTEQRALHEVLWITPSGVVHGGAQAVAKLLLNAGGPWSVAGAVLTLPPVRWPAHAVYRLIAHNRHRMPGGTPACALPANGRPGPGR
ncbi:thiol-disulfide oxidoreductase DCC family protein [Streptomyces sp. NPDC093097]|uniref:thiol-disulfide oxidoreductase DCC family protein n=1 Tax=Streptomyces sp. NPDC093097 TaxID=3366027 RepID=UPI00381E90CF